MPCDLASLYEEALIKNSYNSRLSRFLAVEMGSGSTSGLKEEGKN